MELKPEVDYDIHTHLAVQAAIQCWGQALLGAIRPDFSVADINAVTNTVHGRIEKMLAEGEALVLQGSESANGQSK